MSHSVTSRHQNKPIHKSANGRALWFPFPLTIEYTGLSLLIIKFHRTDKFSFVFDFLSTLHGITHGVHIQICEILIYLIGKTVTRSEGRNLTLFVLRSPRIFSPPLKPDPSRTFVNPQ